MIHLAQRRMVNVKIVDSARFLKMPVSTQALYFHLIVRGDDDGVVEAFNVMRMTGATEDDLKILVAKGFVEVLNDDLVTYHIVTGKQIGRASCRERVSSPV